MTQKSNFLITLAMCINVFALFQMLKIICDPFRNSFELNDAAVSNYQGLSLHGDLEVIAKLSEWHQTLQAFNGGLLMMRLLLVLRFSGELYDIFNLLTDAFLDLIFFILMFSLVRNIHISPVPINLF